MNKQIGIIYKNIFVATIILVSIFSIIIYKHENKPLVQVLFIGNSFTSVNDLPKTFSLIAKSLGNRVDCDMSAAGGYTLKQHSEYATTLDKIKSKPWNFVVLQEQSEMPVFADYWLDKLVTPYAKNLNALIIQMHPSAKTVFYETWGYKNGDQTYCTSTPDFCSYGSMQNSLNKSYKKLADDNSTILAPVGEAWSLVRKTNPEIELYQSDGKHPSPEGTYLAACVFYISIFNKNVVGASSLNLDPGKAKILQNIAAQTVLKATASR
jgi:hypothetical protein